MLVPVSYKDVSQIDTMNIRMMAWSLRFHRSYEGCSSLCIYSEARPLFLQRVSALDEMNSGSNIS